MRRITSLGAEGSQDAMVLLAGHILSAWEIPEAWSSWRRASECNREVRDLPLARTQPGSAAEASSFLKPLAMRTLRKAWALNGKHLEAMSDLAHSRRLARRWRRWHRIASLDAAGGLVQARLRRNGRFFRCRGTPQRQRRWRHGNRSA